jgi:sulfite exporter TauE/SafE
MNPADLTTPIAAFIAGTVTSFHCAVMCGPLGCALLGAKSASPGEWRRAAITYHTARLLSYAVIGALLGSLGAVSGGFFHASISRVLPWLMALFLVVIAFGWERHLPRLPFLSRWLFKLNLRTTALRRTPAAALLGAVTPFLPCGPLYLAFGAALVTGSWLSGTALTAAFALGTIPLYALAQIGALRWQSRLAPTTQIWTRRILALGSAMLVGGRAILHDGNLLTPIRCLLCH